MYVISLDIYFVQGPLMEMKGKGLSGFEHSSEKMRGKRCLTTSKDALIVQLSLVRWLVSLMDCEKGLAVDRLMRVFWRATAIFNF